MLTISEASRCGCVWPGSSLPLPQDFQLFRQTLRFSATTCRFGSTGSWSRSAGSGSSIYSISWTVLTASEAAVIGLGLVVVVLAWPEPAFAMSESVVILASALGFFGPELAPGKAFYGRRRRRLPRLPPRLAPDRRRRQRTDRRRDHSADVLILDSTTTLVSRAWLRKPLATAHRDHAYQHAVDRGIRQDSVVLIVLTLGCLLIGLAAASPPATIPTTLASAALLPLDRVDAMGRSGPGEKKGLEKEEAATPSKTPLSKPD